VAVGLKRLAEILPAEEKTKKEEIKNSLSRYEINLSDTRMLRKQPGNIALFTSALKDAKFIDGALVFNADVILENAGAISLLRAIKTAQEKFSIIVWTTDEKKLMALKIIGVNEFAEIQFNGINEVLAQLNNEGIKSEYIKVINSGEQLVLDEILKDKQGVNAYNLKSPKAKENRINALSYIIEKAVADIVKDERLNEAVKESAKVLPKEDLERLEAITTQIVEVPLVNVDKKVAKFQQSYEQTVTDI
jgi:hypothetical protein